MTDRSERAGSWVDTEAAVAAAHADRMHLRSEQERLVMGEPDLSARMDRGRG